MPFAALIFALLVNQADKPYELTTGFIVSLPGKPLSTLSAQPQLKSWKLPVGDVTYIASVTSGMKPKPGSSPDEDLRLVIAGFVHAGKAELIEQKDVLLQGWKGMQIRARIAGGVIIREQFYIVKDALYSVGAVSKSDGPPFAELPTVFASIKLPGGSGPSTAAGPDFQPFSFPKTNVTGVMPGKPEINESPLEGNAYGLVMHGAAAKYGGRFYLVDYADITEKAKKTTAPDQLLQTLKQANRDMLAAVDGQVSTDRQYARQGTTAMETEFTARNKTYYGRIDSFVWKDRLYFFMVVLPSSFTTSPEISRFFGAITLDDK